MAKADHHSACFPLRRIMPIVSGKIFNCYSEVLALDVQAALISKMTVFAVSLCVLPATQTFCFLSVSFCMVVCGVMASVKTVDW